LFLPEKISVHWNTRGEADFQVDRFWLLFSTVIPYSAYWQFFRKKK